MATIHFPTMNRATSLLRFSFVIRRPPSSTACRWFAKRYNPGDETKMETRNIRKDPYDQQEIAAALDKVKKRLAPLEAEPFGKYRGRDTMLRYLQENRKSKKQTINTHVALDESARLLKQRFALQNGAMRWKELVAQGSFAKFFLGPDVKKINVTNQHAQQIVLELWRYGKSDMCDCISAQHQAMRQQALETQAFQQRAAERRKKEKE